MKLSYYLQKIPYTIGWKLAKIRKRTIPVALYCEDSFDYELFKNIQKYLKPVPVIAKNTKIQEKLATIGVESMRMPQYPETVIMFRNSAWKFPVKEIHKIGFEHGAYNFKRMSKAHYYNMFNVFCMTSKHDVERAKANGVTTAVAVGFPKVDDIFNGSIQEEELQKLRNSYGLDPNKKTLLFSSTWDGSGMSGIHVWYDKIDQLTDKYNILATIHPWMSEKYRSVLEANKDITFINKYEIMREILIADVCIGDTNSLIAEFCLLDKPIITFVVPFTERTTKDVIELIEKSSCRITSFDEIENAITDVLANDTKYSVGRHELINKMIDNRDGKAGERAAEIILQYVPNWK